MLIIVLHLQTLWNKVIFMNKKEVNTAVKITKKFKEEAISLRINKHLKEKLYYISLQGDRSFSAQVERFCKQGVKRWEKDHGIIVFEKPQ